MKKIMAANWKMYKTMAEATETATQLVKLVGSVPLDREVVIFPPTPSLPGVAQVIASKENMAVGGQNFYPKNEGAFTGEVSPAMLQDCKCTYALAGHSERRHVLGESSEFVGEKVRFGLEQGLYVVFCIGETIEERRANQVEEVLTAQLDAGFEDLVLPDSERLVIAYEPVWAIGTGEVAGPEEIVHAHGFIRNYLIAKLGQKGSSIRILYGGSVKPANCSEIIALDNVDGVLVGGASLQADSFKDIVLA